MRVSRALVILTLFTAAVPAGIGAYTASTGTAGTSAGETVLMTMPNGQQREIPAAIATQIAANGGFPGGGQANTANLAGNTAAQTVATVSTIAVLGTVEENRSADLAFQTAGTVSDVYVQVGDYVEAGTVLARLDDIDAQVEYQQALLNLETAQINLDNLLEPPTDDEIQSAQLNITSAQASYSDVANSDDSQLLQLQIRYEEAVENHNLQVQVRANMDGTPEEIALQDAAVGQAAFNAEVARLNLEKAQTPDNSSLWSAGVRVQIAQLQFDQLMAGADESQVQNARLNIDIAQANLAAAETTLRRLEIISPIAGVITAVNVEEGSTTTSSTTAITMTDLSQMWLTAPIHELDLDQVTEGMTADVVLDAIPDETFTATVEQIAWIGIESDGIVQYTARFALQTADQRIRPGMTGEATITPDAQAS